MVKTNSRVRALSSAGPTGLVRAAASAGPATPVRVVPRHGSAPSAGSRAALRVVGNACADVAPVGHSWQSTFAAAMPTYTGRRIRGLAAHDGRIYVGYGDPGARGGRVHVHAIDPTTGRVSGSQLLLAGSQNSQMTEIGGVLFATNLAPQTAGEQRAQPFASNRGGAWSMSGWTDCSRICDLDAVPGHRRAVMVAGSAVDELTGLASPATWLTLDGGLTWRSFRMPAASDGPAEGAGHAVRMMRVGADLFVIARGDAWRWRKVVPSAERNGWAAGWERVVLHDHCQVLSMDSVRTGGNGRFAAWSKGPMWTFDGTRVRRMFGHLDFGQAFCTDSSDAHVYAVTRGAGIVRSLNGVDWFRHPEPGVWGSRGVAATSIAVTGGTIYVGDDSSTIHATASTDVPWQRARTT